MVSQSLPEDAALVATLDSIKPIIDALDCIHSPTSKSHDLIITHKEQSGLQLSTEKPGILLASVILSPVSFSSYQCNRPNLRIRLNLSLVLDTLNILHSTDHTSMQLWISSCTSTLVLRVLRSDSETTCELATLTGDTQDTDFEWESHSVINEALVRPSSLRDAILELPYGDATNAELRMGGDDVFQLCSPPNDPRCTVVIGVDMLETFHSVRLQTVVYRVSYLSRCLKALALSETCRVSVNDIGVLNLMCRIGNARQHECWVQFLIIAQEIDEESDDDEDTVR